MGVALAVGVCAGLAAILLVIPGIIVWCIYAVAIPVCVVERRGVSASLKRSSFLTRGNRWRIFGALAVVLTAIIAIVVVGALLAALAGVSGCTKRDKFISSGQYTFVVTGTDSQDSTLTATATVSVTVK